MNRSIDWPEPAKLENITLSPLLGHSSKANLRIAASPPSPLLQHFRYGTQKSAIEITQLTAVDPAECTVIDEPVIYGGLLFRHFGHLLAESIHRLWPRYAMKELHGAPVAFHPVNNTKILPYMTEALNFYGFSRAQVIPITSPTLFRQLFVGQQARTMAGPTTIPGYQSMLDGQLSWRLPAPGPSRKLYLSRLRHQHSGSYYGETFVQQKLSDAGFEIVYPELHSLGELVSLLRDASIAIFAEGSAVHALELCGSRVPATAIISRRPESKRRFSPLLDDICDRWLIADHLLLTAGLDSNAKKHSGIVDLPSLMHDIGRFAGMPSLSGSSQGMLRAIEQDVEAHIREAATSPGQGRARVDQLRDLVRRTTLQSFENAPAVISTS